MVEEHTGVPLMIDSRSQPSRAPKIMGIKLKKKNSKNLRLFPGANGFKLKESTITPAIMPNVTKIQ